MNFIGIVLFLIFVGTLLSMIAVIIYNAREITPEMYMEIKTIYNNNPPLEFKRKLKGYSSGGYINNYEYDVLKNIAKPIPSTEEFLKRKITK